ncbi:MAG TPA: hypothetical protein D7I06_01340 [Candidatus Poseidoniales archaeon]|mgnify:FL=1|nr:MAG TPA: hypothetical protein D7I06_01340 [Candidatus Poseidoniales archaeon]HII62227.1 hypothetical protein [Candidatus Poseidoniaceae archaeon]|tara:strand:+ start:846 stop:1259 length:414 start_codon:yes stop_codon:yes gene_type:complete
MEESKTLWKWISSSAFLASMCCFPSVVLVMFGLASASTAAALSDQLYWGPFRKWLLLATFIFLSYGLTRYFRQQGVCTLDDAKRERKKVINVSLFTFGMFLVVYTIWNYIILDLIGIAFGIDAWKESSIWPLSLLFD